MIWPHNEEFSWRLAKWATYLGRRISWEKSFLDSGLPVPPWACFSWFQRCSWQIALARATQNSECTVRVRCQHGCLVCMTWIENRWMVMDIMVLKQKQTKKECRLRKQNRVHHAVDSMTGYTETWYTWCHLGTYATSSRQRTLKTTTPITSAWAIHQYCHTNELDRSHHPNWSCDGFHSTQHWDGKNGT